jgi:hypothetical protein
LTGFERKPISGVPRRRRPTGRNAWLLRDGR